MTMTVWTVGHSNHGQDEFLALLRKHDIEVLADVRSAPYSRYTQHFNQGPLQKAAEGAGLQYVFLGRELGGRPRDGAAYDDEGHARYDVMAGSGEFRAGLDRLLHGIAAYRVAIMCAEENPRHCHRRLLIGKVLTEQNPCSLHHIRGDGSMEVEDAVELGDPQLSLLGEASAWRSTQSVSRRSRHASSSSS